MSQQDRIKTIIENVRNQYALSQYKVKRAIIAAPFGQKYFDECITQLTESRAVCELAQKGEILVLVVTSVNTIIGKYPEWLKIIQIDRIPNWPTEDACQNRFIKWAIPLLFTNISCSIYIDSDVIITNRSVKIKKLFDSPLH